MAVFVRWSAETGNKKDITTTAMTIMATRGQCNGIFIETGKRNEYVWTFGSFQRTAPISRDIEWTIYWIVSQIYSIMKGVLIHLIL